MDNFPASLLVELGNNPSLQNTEDGMDNNHSLFLGESGSGKTTTLVNLVRQMDNPVIYFDPQPNGGGQHCADTLESTGKPVVHEKLGTDFVLPMNIAPFSDDERENQITSEMVSEAAGAYRKMSNPQGKVLIQEHFGPYLRLKMVTGKSFSQLQHCWHQETNRRLIEEVEDPQVLRWLLDAPKLNSYQARDRQPAKRFCDVFLNDAIARRDQNYSPIGEIINDGNNVVVSATNKATMAEYSFYMNYRVLEIIRKKMTGEIKPDIVIVLEESNVAGLSPMIARQLMAVRKYGIALWIVSQTGQWDDDEFPITKTIWANTNRIVHRTSSPELLDLLAKDFVSLYDPMMIKRKTQTYRQVVRGYQNVETESVTQKPKSESTTVGSRDRPIYQGWYEDQIQFLSMTEQAQLLKGILSGLNVGQALVKFGNEIDLIQFPKP